MWMSGLHMEEGRQEWGGQVRGTGWEVGPWELGVKEVAGRAKATRTGVEACGQHGRDGRCDWPLRGRMTRVQPGLVLHRKEDLGLGRWPGQSLVPTHRQVHKGEDVELRHDGEAEEHTVQEEAPTSQLLVQLPFVQVNTKYLQ